jgi:hypothetical protein
MEYHSIFNDTSGEIRQNTIFFYRIPRSFDMSLSVVSVPVKV